MLWLRTVNRPLCVGIFLLVLFLINMVGYIYPQYFHITSTLTNVEGRGAEQAIETLEAVLWITALVIFATLFYRAYKTSGWTARSLWFLLYAVLAFLAAGEEMSWGQHLGLTQPSASLADVNIQQELNIHNLNVSKMLGLSAENPLAPALEDIGNIITLVVYLFFTLVWIVIPILKRYGLMRNYKLIAATPSPAVGTVIFFGISVIVYLVIDKLLFDVAELFELAIAFTIVLLGLDIMFKQSMEDVSVDTA